MFNGSFYPAEYYEVIEQFKQFESNTNLNSNYPNEGYPEKINGLIVPHAGWKYSGKTASLAYQLLRKIDPPKISLLGPSHEYPINSIIADNHKQWSTPIGNIKIIHDKHFVVNSTYHRNEHSLEVQMPFIKYYTSDAQVLPLVVGQIDQTQAAYCAEYFVKQDYFLIISTDLSHFHSIKLANEIDKLSIAGIEKLLVKDVEACGIFPLKVAFEYCKLKNTKPCLIDYSTSAEVSGNHSSVVGYASFYF